MTPATSFIAIILSLLGAVATSSGESDVELMSRRRWLTDGKRLATLTPASFGEEPRCTIFTDRALVRTMLQRLQTDQVERLPRPHMEELLQLCDLQQHGQAKERSKRALFIFPGTLWCGHGDSAHNSSDLGEKREADACCRDHDHCPVKIYGLSSRYGLFNSRPYTRLSCECEETFYQCLKQAGDGTATAVGRLYFSLFSGACLQPSNTVTCSSSSWWGWLTSRCDETHQGMKWGEFNKQF